MAGHQAAVVAIALDLCVTASLYDLHKTENIGCPSVLKRGELFEQVDKYYQCQRIWKIAVPVVGAGSSSSIGAGLGAGAFE